MPLYVYACPNGHEVEEQRPMAERDAPIHCARCGKLMQRRPALVAPNFPGAASWYSTLLERAAIQTK